MGSLESAHNLYSSLLQAVVSCASAAHVVLGVHCALVLGNNCFRLRWSEIMSKFLKAIKREILPRYVAIFALFGFLFLSVFFVADAAEKYPIIRSRIVTENTTEPFARATFEWVEPNDFIANSNGKTVTINFDRNAKINPSSLVSGLSPYITSSRFNNDSGTLTLTMNKPYKIRTFLKDNISGIDFLGVDPKAKENTKKELAKKAQEKKEHLKNLSLAKAKEQKLAKTAEEFAKLEPAIGKSQIVTNALPVPPNASNVEGSTNIAPSSTTQITPPTISEKTVESKKIDSEGQPTPPVIIPQESEEKPEKKEAQPDDSLASPNVQSEEKKVINKVGVSAADDSATLRFPLAERTALSVFNRNHYLWIVIGKPIKLDLSDFSELSKTVIGKPEIISNSKATILYMPMDDNVYPSITKEDNSDNFAIILTQKKKSLSSPMDVSVSTAPPAPPHVLISTLEMSEPIIVRDPVIGDSLIITPVFRPSEGVENNREFIDFSLLSTSQGIAVAKKSDDVVAVQLRNGIRITTKQGASISPGLPKLDIKNTNSGLQETPTIYPYNMWKLDGNQSRKNQLQRLLHLIVGYENIQDANNVRLKMAEFYLGEGLAPEAIALLDGINRTNPAFYRTAKLAGLRGAANFLMSRYIESGRDFAASELNNNKEMDYWRAVLADLLGNPGQTYDYLAMNEDYISKYPPIFRQRLAIVAADRAISANEYNIALKIFDSLHNDNLLDSINVYIKFLMAKISISTGQEKDANDTLEKLSNDEKHPFVRARAEFTRISRDMDAGEDKDNIIDSLERLRLNWHGDGLELKILTILGELYYEKKDYVNAMRVWNNGVQSFKNTAVAIDMARKMSETFIVMFNEGTAEKLPPLEALALYYEYRNYMPSGTAGNEMIERLAERLIGLDLLEQAADLLNHQMRAQLEKEPRSRIGSKLAAIYLLNHQPQKALTSLQDSVYGDNQVLLRLERNRLASEAMVELGKPDLAMQTLGQDDSKEAERIRVQIHWQAKDWKSVTSSIENLLKLRSDITAPINVDESEYIIKLALAYVFQDNREQLQYLRDYFSPLMISNPNKKVFEFVTSQDVIINSRNLDGVLKSISNTKSFIQNYNARIYSQNTNEVMSKIKK